MPSRVSAAVSLPPGLAGQTAGRAGRATLLAALLLAPAVIASGAVRGDDGWVELAGLEAWRTPIQNWEPVGSVFLDGGNTRRLAATPGVGAIYNGPTGRGSNLVSKQSFGDVEVHAEFLIPKGSNSGIKLQEVYEVQIFDSYNARTITADDCGGIYPRAEFLPRYHHIDKGYPPRVNACKPPGEWQTLDIVFHAPRFEAGKKTANARFVSVKLNGRVVQQDLELPCPTGNNWRNPEHPSGRLLLQGDHGAVAFRNVRVRPHR